MEPSQRPTDSKHVRRFLLGCIAALLFFLLTHAVFGYEIRYAEQFYKLYHSNFYMYPTDFGENIWYLEKALGSDFANPLNALALIENQDQWERYRYLFYMHVN